MNAELADVARIVTSRRGASTLKWLAALAVMFVVAEVTCRIEDWVRYDMPLATSARSLDDLVLRDADGMHGRPQSVWLKWKMNRLGMRGPDVSALAAQGIVRVVTAGGSETFGLYESAGREFARQLEDSLNVGCGSPPQFQVLNAAFPGMSLPTVVQDLRMRVSRLRPNVVVLYPSPAQYLLEAPPNAAMRYMSANAGAQPFRQALHPRLRERIRAQGKALIPDAAKDWLREREIAAYVARHPANHRFRSIPPDRIAAFELDVRRVVGTIRAIGATPVLGTHGNAFMGVRTVDRALLTAWERFYPRATGTAILSFDSAARSVVMKVAADSAVVVVDVASRLAAEPRGAFADFSHLTDSGSAVVASELARGVRQVVRRTCGVP